MNDLYCKDFEFLNDGNQKAFNRLKETIQKRAKLDLEFLEKFIAFSSECLGTTQFACAKGAYLYKKDTTEINYLSFCAEYLGLSESTVKKLYLVYERFVLVVDYPKGKKSCSFILPEFNDIPLSKIFELLSVSINDLQTAFDAGKLNVNMTQKQLRDWVKLHNNGTESTIDVKESINDELVEDDDDNQDTLKLKTYNKILDYIEFFKTTEESDATRLKKLFVTDLHSIKNALKKEFNLEVD